MTDLYLGDRFAAVESMIDRWLAEFADDPIVVAVDKSTDDASEFGAPRWYIRLAGEAKEFVTIWLTLRQRTLSYETYVIPAATADPDGLHRYVLRRNDQLVGACYSIGAEDALYLRGALPDAAVSPAEIDRVIGTLYATVENHFADLLRLAFGVGAAPPPDSV